jgi:DNA processing protein
MMQEQSNLFPYKHNPGSELKADPVGALALYTVKGVGSARFRALLNAFGSPAEVFSAGEKSLREVPGIDEGVASCIIAARDNGDGAELYENVQRCQAAIVSIWDPEYPEKLREIHDPPALLFVRGALPAPQEICIAVVGTRTPNLYGMRVAHLFAEDLASRGVAVISGMARGIDTSAHEGALRAGGRTFAVFGCGVDVIYPQENETLAEKIRSSGGLISESLPGTPPDSGLFPRRNRIISGMSRGTLVVQGGETSGALITARCALEQNREVFAVPGAVDDKRSRGPHLLIRQGALLVETAEDILKELGAGSLENRSEAPPINLPPPNASEERVLAKLSREPRHIDELVRELQSPVAAILADLLGLEMKGWVVQSPGKLFSLKDY